MKSLQTDTAVYLAVLAKPNEQCKTWSWLPRLWSGKIASNFLLLHSQEEAKCCMSSCPHGQSTGQVFMHSVKK